jgi:hypothetical protein
MPGAAFPGHVATMHGADLALPKPAIMRAANNIHNAFAKPKFTGRSRST